MRELFRKVLFKILKKIKIFYESEQHIRLNKRYALINTNLAIGFISGDVHIGEYTYINEGYRIVTGNKSKVRIGKYCTIGRNFSCASRTHDKALPTPDEFHPKHKRREADILVEDCVWIGDNVVVREGVIIHSYAIVGANSVVTKDVKQFEIVGGVPARHIAYNTQHYLYNDKTFFKK